MAWISWSSTYLRIHLLLFFCFFKTHNPVFVFCLLICLFVFVHTAEMYLADKMAEISMISGTEYFHVFNSCPVHFRRPGYFSFKIICKNILVRNIETLTKVRHI